MACESNLCRAYFVVHTQGWWRCQNLCLCVLCLRCTAASPPKHWLAIKFLFSSWSSPFKKESWQKQELEEIRRKDYTDEVNHSHVVTFPGGDKGVRLPSNYSVDEIQVSIFTVSLPQAGNISGQVNVAPWCSGLQIHLPSKRYPVKSQGQMCIPLGLCQKATCCGDPFELGSRWM